MTDRVWVLGASDPEMEAIERLLRDCGERVVYALTSDGRRVTAAEAYRMAPLSADATPWGGEVYLVECDTAEPWPQDAEGAPMPYRLVRRSDAPCEPGDPDDRDECYVRIRRIDHHRPGDPGYGRPPKEFMSASSIGQVVSVLAHRHLDHLRDRLAMPGNLPWPATPAIGGAAEAGEIQRLKAAGGLRWLVRGPLHWHEIPDDIVFAAAADHCLAAAYRGECPGIDPDALMRWRVETRAAHQGRSPEEILADVERAREALRSAPVVVLSHRHIERTTQHCFDGISCAVDLDGLGICGCACDGCTGQAELVVRWERVARDMRGRHVPELPEASAREGICFVADGLPGRDGRVKIVCQSGTPEQIRAFMTVWAPAQGLVDIYGDPERGFAGGYLQEGTR